VTIEEAIAAGLAQHQAGRLTEAERIYRQVLTAAPGNAEALHLLGVLAGQTGNLERAVELIQAAIGSATSHGIAPAGVARYWCNLGNSLLALGRKTEAVESYRTASRLDAGFVDAWVNQSHALRLSGDFLGAVAAGREAVRQREIGGGWVALGLALAMQGGPEGLAEAIACFQRALTLMPGDAATEGNLAYALWEAGRVEDSVKLCQEIVVRRPGDAIGWKNLGLGLHNLGRIDEAIEAYRRALSLPGSDRVADAWSGLGNDLMGRGEIEEAVSCFEKAAAAHPGNSWVHSNLLYALHLDPRVDARGLFAAHQEWVRQHASQVARFSHERLRPKGKHLRVGYMSADLRDHPVGRFMLPLIRRHVAHGEINLVLYSDARFRDPITEEFRRVVEVGGGLWRDIEGLGDDAVAERVRQDGVDVLVDLSMHAGHNRMLVFARKPAPIQVTYLAYPGTTALAAIDWRFSDRYFDPPEREGLVADEAPQAGIYSERTWRLRSYWCYTPPKLVDGAQAIEVAPLPAAQDGVVTFGCLNNFAKVSRGVVDAWGRILQNTQKQGVKSRLILHARVGSHRERLLSQLAAHGVGRERVEFAGWMPEREFFALHGRIDVGLDPFPYCGGTTTCHALWMGVPVVTLKAPPAMPAVGRGGASILSTVGLTELVAESVDEYVRIAVELAGDVGRLAMLRSNMRARMAASPLMDVEGFVREIEEAYRQMWDCG
jgi:protein O-GlcNAc transferase